MPFVNTSVSENCSVLGPTLRFKGELHADEDLQIFGQVEGSITHSKYLTIGKEGQIKADIHGHIIAVQGKVEGNVTAETSVAITDTGHLNGDIRAPSISINDGADFNGKVVMEVAKHVRTAAAEHRNAHANANSDAARGKSEE